MLPASPTASFPYRVLRRVGQGAMGDVFEAHDVELERKVAIKVIRAEHVAALGEGGTEAAVHRFLQEARAAAALSHPGVTTVHRIGREGGWPYIAMEWLEGRTLEAALAECGRLPVAHAAAIGEQVLSALAVAHAAGIVHRDIKPANLMIVDGGRIKLTDFGIARVRGSTLTQTQQGMVIGTPQYAAPEQLAGAALDCRADLYAVAAVLYEAVVGAPPLPASSLYELLLRVQTEDPPAPSSLVAGLPPAFDAFVARGLAREPARRFASATEMREALAELRRGGRAPAPTPVPLVAPAPVVATPSPPPPTVTTARAAGHSPHALVRAAIEGWSPGPLPRLPRAHLLQRLLERPLHAPAFAGAVVTDSAWLLVSDGLVHAAFDPADGSTGDHLIDALPDEVSAVLRPLPEHLDRRTVALLASLLAPPAPRLEGLSASFADLPRVAARLADEGFDGALRLARGSALGFVLFARGRRVLDVLGDGWPAGPWEAWIGDSGALASVEPTQVRFPAFTFRQQLADAALEVVRPPPPAADAARVDTVAAAAAIALRPAATTQAALRRGDHTLHCLIAADPAVAAARWLVAELGGLFRTHGRARHWKGLVAPLDQITEVRLHHGLPTGDGGVVHFDAVCRDARGRPLHVLDRVARGTRAVVEDALARIRAAKAARPEPDQLVAALVLAPSFDDDALAAYQAAIRPRASLRSGLDALAHREGFVRDGRRGFHLLLVEEAAGGRRPLVTE